MIHWLFLIYWICKYAYTGEFNELPFERNCLIFFLGFLENGIWIGAFDVLEDYIKINEKSDD